MRSTSNTSDNLDIPPVNASNQSEACPSTSRHLVMPTQLPQITTNLSNAEPLNSQLPQDNETKSTTELLKELSIRTLGSILSLLMQHCDPPQRYFPYDNGVPPPWWPTTKEDWWGQTGISRDEGSPPFKRPHVLRKKWKVAVIVGIMKSMSPNYSRPYNLVEQSHQLQLRMNARERRFWTLALVAEAKQYCREHPDMPVDEAIAFVEACGGSSSRIAPNLGRKNISVFGNEAPGFSNPSGVVHGPPLELPSNTTSAWPTAVPPMGHLQQGFQVSSIAPYQQMAMSGSFAPQNSPWAFSYPPFVEQPGEAPSTSGTRDVQNQMHEYGANMEFGFEPSSDNQNSTSGHY